MTYLLIPLVKSLLIIIFLIKYINTKINNKSLLLSIVFLYCSLYYMNYASIYSVFILLTIPLNVIFLSNKLKQKFRFSYLMIGILIPILLLLSDFLSNIPYLIFAEEYWNKFYTTNFISPIVLTLFFYVISTQKEKYRIFFTKERWIKIIVLLFEITIMLFIITHITVKRTYNPILITILMCLIIFHCFLFVSLLIDMQEDGIKIQEILLDNQKSYYIKKNSEMIKQLHNEILMIEHSTIYNLIHIKSLLVNKKHVELMNFIDACINKFKKIRYLITSKNQYFNYSINNKLHHISSYHPDIKVSSTLANASFHIDKEDLNSLLKLFEIIKNDAFEEKTLQFNFSLTSSFLKFQAIYVRKQNNLDYDLKYFLDNLTNFNYSIKTIQEFEVLTVLIDCNIEFL